MNKIGTVRRILRTRICTYLFRGCTNELSSATWSPIVSGIFFIEIFQWMFEPSWYPSMCSIDG